MTTLYLCINIVVGNIIAYYRTISIHQSIFFSCFFPIFGSQVSGGACSVWDLVEFPFFIPQVPLAHPNYPLNGQFGKISSLEESHEDPGQNGNGAPGISCHYLLGKRKPASQLLQADDMKWRRTLPFYSVVCTGPATGKPQNKAG